MEERKKKKRQPQIIGSTISFRISAETEAMIHRIAQTQNCSVSSVYRDMIDRGLASAGYRSGSEDLRELVGNTLEELLKPQVERLATISAKGTQLSAAAFFLLAYIGNQHSSYPEEFESIATQARKLGIEYLKLSKDRSLDDFIRGGVTRMNHE